MFLENFYEAIGSNPIEDQSFSSFLSEARIVITSRASSPDKSIWCFFKSKEGPKKNKIVPPYVIIRALDGLDVSKSNRVQVVKVTPKKYLEKLHDLVKAQHYKTPLTSYDDLINRMFGYIQYPSRMDMNFVRDLFFDYEEYVGDAFTKKKVYNPQGNQFITDLVSVYDIDPAHFTHMGLESFSAEGGHHDIKIGNVEVVYQSTVKKEVKKAIEEVLNDVKDTFHAHGLDKVFSGKILVNPHLPHNVLGQYRSSVKTMDVTSKLMNTKMLKRTLIHEYGHKWYYEFLNDSQRKAIEMKFAEVRGKGNVFVSSGKEALDKHITSQLIDQMLSAKVITYVGGDRKPKKFNPYEFNREMTTRDRFVIDSVEKQKYLIGGKYLPVASFHGTPRQFIQKWKFDGVFYGIDVSDDMKFLHNGWFPTAYSETDANEWHSELFAFYMLGELKYAPAVEFIRATLK